MRIVQVLIIVVLFQVNLGFSQYTTSGFVLDAFTEEPLMGVSIFYDASTIGTITDEKGFFELTSEKIMTTNLVVSYIGFETIILDGSTTGLLKNILLKEKAIKLDEVVLKPDNWSRQKKLAIFRRQFIGSTPASLRCKILNEDAIRLYYDQDKNILYAYADKPIIINNNSLGYSITYTLNDFEVQFFDTPSGSSGVNAERSAYFVGLAFFSELNPKKKKSQLNKQKKLYAGSTLHFMRALSKKRLALEGFQVFKNKLEVEPYSEFRLDFKKEVVQIFQSGEELSILYDKKEQSSIKIENSFFYVDNYGNHMPPKNVLIGGEMAQLRIAGMLPLDYGL